MNRYDRLRDPACAVQGPTRSGRFPEASSEVVPPLLTRDQLRYHERLGRQRSGDSLSLPAILLVLAGVTYNGALAFLNARGFYVGRPIVVVTEILILSAVSLLILTSSSKRVDGAPVIFFAFFLVDALLVSLFSATLFVDMARNAAIIALFALLGTQINSAALTRCFLAASIAVAAALLLEIVSVDTYARLFEPASYFAQTRDIAPSEFDDRGLFSNALGFEDRYSILQIINHRASSIFLEQVSLGNFAIVLAIFVCCRWQVLGLGQKAFLISLIALTVITTASRAASGLVLAAPLAYWVAPKLNRYATLLIMPAVLAVALIVTRTFPLAEGDTLEGRLGYTVERLGELDLSGIAGLNALGSSAFADSGYVYVIQASSILGLVLLWLFVSLVAAGKSPNAKRCSLMLALYVFANLTVSGTSIFSIKSAALLWLLVGFMRHSERAPADVTHKGPRVRAAPRSVPATVRLA